MSYIETFWLSVGVFLDPIDIEFLDDDADGILAEGKVALAQVIRDCEPTERSLLLCEIDTSQIYGGITH